MNSTGFAYSARKTPSQAHKWQAHRIQGALARRDQPALLGTSLWSQVLIPATRDEGSLELGFGALRRLMPSLFWWWRLP